jgi:hypothetical protein
MTIKQLITELQTVLDESGGKDLEIFADIDNAQQHEIIAVLDVNDRALVMTMSSFVDYEQRKQGLWCEPDKAHRN